MFCGECGAKNEKDAAFCAECGAKLEQEAKAQPKKESKKQTSKKKENRKQLSKKQKILIIVGAVIVVALFSLYQIGAHLTDPKQIVKGYIEAVNNRDYDKLYDYANYSGDKTFISKEIYKNELEDSISDDIKINNYNIGNVTYEDGGLTANVAVNISVSNGNESNTDEVTFTLTKLKDKKYLFFDNWTLDSQDMINATVIKDYEISVPKDTVVTFNEIEVTDKYLKNSTTDDNKETYVLPQVFNVTTKISFKLSNGITIEKEVTPSTYYKSYDLEITKSDITSEEQEKMISAITTSVESAMEGLSTSKSFDDIKGNFASDSNLDDLKEEYEDYLDDLSERKYTISNFKITKASIYSVSFDTDYKLKVQLRVNYSYTATSKEDGETKDQTDYDYYQYYLVYEDGYKIADMDELPYTYAYFF